MGFAPSRHFSPSALLRSGTTTVTKQRHARLRYNASSPREPTDVARREDFYRVHFENKFLRLTREDFQSWFVEIMEWAYLGDFIATRQGTSRGGGDRACDGFRASTGTVYAVYAPRHCSLGELNEKIAADFREALANFGNRMREWVFVHNDDRLSTDTLFVIADLQRAHPTVRIGRHIAQKELWEIVRSLEPRFLHRLFPVPPSAADVDRLCIADLQPVLRFVEQQPPPLDLPMTPPSVDKLEHNRLSAANSEMLSVGRRRETLVQRYFEGCSYVELGESIAQTMRERYGRMRNAQWPVDAIFTELYKLAGGFHFHSAIEQAAIYAVLSYYFERCDIFENPNEVSP